MEKYKLIKTYPGSPELGTIVEQESSSKSYFFRSENGNICVLKNHVEDNPEYWKKFNEYSWYAVFKKPYMQDDKEYFTPWKIYMIETLDTESPDRRLFKSHEEAEEYLLYNKPCLSLNNVRGLLDKVETDIIKGFIKSKL
jgi:hypothetical protein